MLGLGNLGLELAHDSNPAIAEAILASSTFKAPLTHSLNLTRGSGSATFTRATTATVFDNEGKLITVPSGASRHVGARYVRNLLTYTEDFSNAAWTKSDATVTANATTAPDGSVTADKLVESAVTNFHRISCESSVVNTGTIITISIYAKAGERSGLGLFPYSSAAGSTFNLANGTVISHNAVVTASITSVGNGWYRCSASIVAPGTSPAPWILPLLDGATNYTGDGTSGIYIWGAQLENVTGQADQTASEYVSVGVPTGTTVADSILSNGTFDSDSWWTKSGTATISDGAGHLVGVSSLERATIATSGVGYEVTYTITVRSGNMRTQIGGAQGTTRTASGTYTDLIVASGGTTFYLVGTAGSDVDVDNVTCKPSAYHGLAVDGIKAFQTHKSGSPIAASSLEGYLSEPAATNNILYCRDLLAGAKAGAWIPSTTGAAVFSDDFSTYADTAAMLAAGWTEGNGGVATLVSDKLRITQGTANGFTGKAFSTTVGETYVAVVAVTKNAASFAGIVIGSTLTNGSIYVNQTINASGVVTVTFVATHTTTYLTCQVMGSVAGAYHEFDNITVTEAALVPTLTATGIDGAANSATTLTAVADNATILQPRTLASAARSSSAYIKRRTGTGNVYFTRDGGTTWTDITSSLSTSAWYRAKIENSSVTNPSVGFKLSTSGDAIDVDYVQDEANAIATSPIATTTATVTRNIDSLTYQYSGNALDSLGSAFAKLYRPGESTISVTAVAIALKDANGRLMFIGTGSAATQLSIYDGTNVVSKSGLPPINTMIRKCASLWGPSSLKVAASGMSVASGIYFDGAMGTTGSSISVGGGSIALPFNGMIKDVHIWQTALTDAQMKAITQ